MRRTTIALGFLLLASTTVVPGATITDAGASRFQLTEFAVGYITPLTSIAVDQESGTVYAVSLGAEMNVLRANAGDEFAAFAGQLRPFGDENVNLVFPWRSTDIVHHNDGVFTLLGGSQGALVRLDLTTEDSTRIVDLGASPAFESGVAIFGSDLVVTSGRGAFELFVYNFDSESVTHTMDVDFEPGDLEADPLNKMFGYVAPVEAGPILHVNPYTGASTETGVGSPVHGEGDFAVGPRGEFIYMVQRGGEIWELDIETGDGVKLFETESDPALVDLAFGPSSSSDGVSLYITESDLIWEASGFSAIPEPTTGAILLLGISAYSFRRVRKNLELEL